jgi:hypothetical protein
MARKCFWPCLKAVIRTLFYQVFLLFVLCSLVVIIIPEQVGFRVMTLHMSYLNHFHPVSFEKALPLLKRIGEWRIWAGTGFRQDFKVIEDAVALEEWYWCKYQYTNRKGILVTEINSTHLRWKPWEYYYELEDKISEEELRDYIENGSLNSRETDNAWKLREELKRMKLERTEV